METREKLPLATREFYAFFLRDLKDFADEEETACNLRTRRALLGLADEGTAAIMN